MLPHQKSAKFVLPLPLIGVGVLLLAMTVAGYAVFKDKLSSPITNDPIAVAITPVPSSQASLPPEANPDPGKFDLISSANSELYQTFAQIPNVPQGTFNYGGSITFAPLRSDTM